MNRKNPTLLLAWLALWIWLAACQSTSDSASSSKRLPAVVDYNFHIRPILSDRCFACHGFDENAREAELRLDEAEAAYRLLDNGRQVISPGKLKNSEFWHRIHSEDPELVMPPPESNLTLTSYEKALLTKWIEQGAEYKDLWSFTTPVKPELPKVSKKDWANNEIDHFILEKLEGTGLSVSEPERKEKLLRRLSFDLTGLPPSPEDLETFIADESPNAYEKQVDRLLGSAHYGERMASIWLEAARYADSHGYQDDRPRTIWPWRDWVIKAYNENLPYDDFITWQLAGDLLPNSSYEQKLATAFNRNHGITQEGGVVNEEYITEYVADRTNTVATAFLGLTMECARCHDHKYDPISQKDYYQMFAFFNGINERGQINYFDEAPKPHMRMEDPDLEEKIKWLDSLRTAKATDLVEWDRNDQAGFNQWLEKDYPTIDVKAELNRGLIAHYQLDEFEALASPSALPNRPPARANIKIISELISPVVGEGKDGNALQFDGRNYLSLGDVGDFEGSDHFTISAFVKPMQRPEKLTGLLARRNGEQKRAGYELVLTPSGQLQAGIFHDKNKEKAVVESTRRIQVGQWTHISMTYDGSGLAAGISVYINGEKQSTTTLFDQLNRKSILNGNDFLVGNWTPRRARSGQYQGFDQGWIDEVRIYDRTLSALEVATLVGKTQPYAYPGVKQSPKHLAAVKTFYRNRWDKTYSAKQKTLDSLRSIYLEVPYIMVMEEMEEPRPTHILSRGAYDSPLERVQASTPATLPSFPAGAPQNRLGLAQWLTQADHPLTGRVIINRLWQMLFGRGLVSTPEDFGNQGALPSHPELLDWLAVTFVEDGWDIKAMLKRMALSATYRQSAERTPTMIKLDPDNILLSCGPYQRLGAEMLRDQALASSDLLNPKVGGKWVKPYQPAGIWKELANQIGENKYRESRGEDLYRRSIYSYWKRTIPPPVMLTFDASERAVCVVKRQSTSTPLQALVLLNDPQFLEASRALAQSVMQTENESEAWVKAIFTRLTSRQPDDAELTELLQLLEEERGNYQADPDAAKALLSLGASPLNSNLVLADLAALTLVANVILNLDEAKMQS
ncbi:MAG: DUF1553 domain-containing protein [Saprospiraceae bacterium]|nr:DUF1553 domain-containing protein [Saprospiraceae bacterium]